MENAPRTFVDSSVFFSAVLSAEGGSRLILKLGEAGVVCLLISPQVLLEVQGVVNRKTPELLPLVGLLLECSGVEVVTTASPDKVRLVQDLVGHPGDAQIVADAVQAQASFLVTLDKAHLLENSAIKGAVTPRIVSPSDFIAWFRRRAASGKLKAQEHDNP